MLATSSPWISALPLRLVPVFTRLCVRLSTLLACRFSSHLVTTMATHPLQNAPSSKQCSTQARTTSGSATRRLRMCAPRTGCGHPVFRQGALPPIHALGLSIGRASSLDRRCLERTTHLLVACHAHPTTERARPRGGRSSRRGYVSCWDVFADDDAVLPMRRPALHAFGHDHSNLFVSARESLANVTYVAAFKSGRPPSSYDAAFYPGSSGFTVLSVPTPGERSAARHNRTHTFTGEDLGRFYVQRATVTQARCDLL